MQENELSMSLLVLALLIIVISTSKRDLMMIDRCSIMCVFCFVFFGRGGRVEAGALQDLISIYILKGII